VCRGEDKRQAAVRSSVQRGAMIKARCSRQAQWVGYWGVWGVGQGVGKSGTGRQWRVVEQWAARHRFAFLSFSSCRLVSGCGVAMGWGWVWRSVCGVWCVQNACVVQKVCKMRVRKECVCMYGEKVCVVAHNNEGVVLQMKWNL